MTNTTPRIGALRLLVLLTAALLLSGCNTIQGVGKDLKRAGDKIERSADGR
jgi:entericidin A